MSQEKPDMTATQRLYTKVCRIEEALCGDPYNPAKPGFVKIVTALHNEVHGDTKTQFVGLKENVINNSAEIQKIKDDKIKLVAACGGATTVILILWAVVKGFVFKQ